MLTKLLPIIAAVCIGGGTFLGAKVFAPKPVDYDQVRKIIAEEIAKIPPTVCPAAVELNNFDLEKINNKKGGQFHLHNTLSNVTIKIEAKDSLLLKQILKAAR